MTPVFDLTASDWTAIFTGTAVLLSITFRLMSYFKNRQLFIESYKKGGDSVSTYYEVRIYPANVPATITRISSKNKLIADIVPFKTDTAVYPQRPLDFCPSFSKTIRMRPSSISKNPFTLFIAVQNNDRPAEITFETTWILRSRITFTL